MSWEKKHPLHIRGRDLPDRGADRYHTVSLIVHKLSEKQCLVSLVVTDSVGNKVKDTRLGECWIRVDDEMGVALPPYRLLQRALEKLLAQPGARLLPDGYDTSAKRGGSPSGA